MTGAHTRRTTIRNLAATLLAGAAVPAPIRAALAQPA
jgi:hypothetical protein